VNTEKTDEIKRLVQADPDRFKKFVEVVKSDSPTQGYRRTLPKGAFERVEKGFK